MKVQMYSLYDSKAELYHKPFYQANDKMAIRSVTGLFKEQNEISNHPEDFTLFLVGEFDDDTAQLTPFAPESVIRLHELAAKLSEQET